LKTKKKKVTCWFVASLVLDEERIEMKKKKEELKNKRKIFF